MSLSHDFKAIRSKKYSSDLDIKSASIAIQHENGAYANESTEY